LRPDVAAGNAGGGSGPQFKTWPVRKSSVCRCASAIVNIPPLRQHPQERGTMTQRRRHPLPAASGGSSHLNAMRLPAPARLRPGRAPPSTCTMPRLRQLARPFVVPDCGLIQFRVPWSGLPGNRRFDRRPGFAAGESWNLALIPTWLAPGCFGRCCTRAPHRRAGFASRQGFEEGSDSTID